MVSCAGVFFICANLSWALALRPNAPASPPPTIYQTASSIPDPPPQLEPFKPTFFDDVLLSIFRWTLQRQSGVSLPHLQGFDGMMAELHELRRTKGTDELERVSLQTMTALAGPIPFLHRVLFVQSDEADGPSANRNSYPTAYALAWFAKYLLPFLVGEMTLTSTSTTTTTAHNETDNTDIFNTGIGGGLLVERCRVLEGSNCKGICAKMCKVPTERFFAERWGMPLSMEPNFETGSCQLRFGVVPLPLEEDATIPSGCLGRCPAAGEGGCD
mmetsp:Transcript_2147/g.3693  ORF Transcript_2147/g.3693 Transcript_2147/m.3693 type:complete len:272 (+) Transcript_2147:35-850(+)